MCPAHTCRDGNIDGQTRTIDVAIAAYDFLSDGQSVESLSRAMASVDSDGQSVVEQPLEQVAEDQLLPRRARAFPGLATGNDSISEASCLKRLRHGAAWNLLVDCVSTFMSLLYPHTIRSNILILLHASCFISLLCSVTLPGSSASPHRIAGARALISRCDSIPTSGPRQFNHGRARRRRTRRCRACPGTHRCTSPRCSTTAIGGPTSARWSEPNTSSEGCSSWLFDVMAAARLSASGRREPCDCSEF